MVFLDMENRHVFYCSRQSKQLSLQEAYFTFTYSYLVAPRDRTFGVIKNHVEANCNGHIPSVSYGDDLDVIINS